MRRPGFSDGGVNGVENILVALLQIWNGDHDHCVIRGLFLGRVCEFVI
jgi:hypothetical protein